MLASFAATDAVQRGDVQQGKAWLQRAVQLAYRRTGHKDAYHLGAPYHVAACNLALLEGDIPLGVTRGRAAVEVATRGGWLSYKTLAHIAWSEALDDAGEHEAADEQIVLAQNTLDRSSTATLEFTIRLLKADFLLRRNRRADGLALLADAMTIGERTESRRTCLTPMRSSRLMAVALAERIAPDYALLLVREGDLPPPPQRIEQWPWPLKITTFGDFQILRDGKPIEFSRKVPRRLFQLLKALIVFGGKDVLISRIVDTVWPDEDGDAGTRSFDVAIHRLRKMIGDGQSIVVRNGRVSLHAHRCWLDIWAFEDAIDDADERRSQQALQLYRGVFLPSDDELPWAAPRRQQLERRYLRAKQRFRDMMEPPGWRETAH